MDKSKLKQIYSKFLLLPFPLSERHKKANEWITELTEIDRFYAALAESLIMEKPIEMKELPSLKALTKSLKNLQQENGINEERYQEYKLYLASLNKLAKEIAKEIGI